MLIILNRAFCQVAGSPVCVTVHSYLVPATIYAHKINCIDFGACKLVIFMHNLHENTSRHTTCVQ